MDDLKYRMECLILNLRGEGPAVNRLAIAVEAAAELARLTDDNNRIAADALAGSRALVAALENVERLTAEVERRQADAERYRSAIRWALGYEEGEPEFEPPEGDRPRYWWRKELRRRACDVDAAMTKEAGNG